MSPNPTQLQSLPPELLLQILSHLDIPDQVSLSRTSQALRILSLDPLLHVFRLRLASSTLSTYLPLRPSLHTLMLRHIYITRTTLAARHLGRNLIRIKLNKQLLRRPSVETLVEKGVLPGECYRRGMAVAPGLVEMKRRVERERVKDVLRGWVEEWRRRGSAMGDEEARVVSVKRMARRFTREKGRDRDGPRWGGQVERRMEGPTRAKVLGLRRFWEKVGKEGVAA